MHDVRDPQRISVITLMSIMLITSVFLKLILYHIFSTSILNSSFIIFRASLESRIQPDGNLVPNITRWQPITQFCLMIFLHF